MIEASRRFHRPRPGVVARFRAWLNTATGPRDPDKVLTRYQSGPGLSQSSTWRKPL